MVKQWQIVKSPEKEKYLLFFDGSKQDLAFIYRKISLFVESARYAQKPYNYCFLLKDIDSGAIDNIKKIMSLLTEITKETPLAHDFQEEAGGDFFARLQKSILNIAKLKSEKYKGERHIEEPRDLGIEIEKTRGWQVVGEKGVQKPQMKSDDFFDKLQNQLINLGKSKLKKVYRQETTLQEEAEKKPALDLAFFEKFLAEPKLPAEKPPAERKIPPAEKPQPPKVGAEKAEYPQKPKKEISGVTFPKRFQFENSKNPKFSPFAPVNPLQNFDTLQITSSNRNSHALAISVAQSPGEYDIPFTITGAPNTGKTHFLNAICNAIQRQLGADKILFTTGIRLSKLLSIPAKDSINYTLGKKPDEFDALLVDDVCNMLITNTNKAPLAALFEKFQRSRKQIVFTSKFARDKLESVFAEKDFKIPLMSTVELKYPSDEEYTAILKAYALAMGIEESDTILASEGFKPSFKDIKRVCVLKNLAENFPKEPSEMISLIKGERNSFGVPASELGRVSLFKLPDENLWGRWGVFYHKETADYAKYVLYKLYETAKKLGVSGGWENVFLQSYDNADIKFFPAQMADYAYEEKVNSVLAIGPHSEHPFHKYAAEFFGMLRDACQDIGLNCGCVAYDDLSNPAIYSATLADLLE